MEKLTQWFTSRNPVHIGWYQRKYPCPSLLSPDWWDGKEWFVGDGSGQKIMTLQVFWPWRGLAVKPKSGISSKS